MTDGPSFAYFANTPRMQSLNLSERGHATAEAVLPFAPTIFG